MHLVHRNIKYGDKKLALQNEDGFAVIGILFQMSGSAPNLPYLRYLDLIRNLGTEVQLISYLQGFKISDFAGDLNEEFVTYRGSLTTPPCSEAVTWIIATQTRLISKFDVSYKLLNFLTFYFIIITIVIFIWAFSILTCFFYFNRYFDCVLSKLSTTERNRST